MVYLLCVLDKNILGTIVPVHLRVLNVCMKGNILSRNSGSIDAYSEAIRNKYTYVLYFMVIEVACHYSDVAWTLRRLKSSEN